MRATMDHVHLVKCPLCSFTSLCLVSETDTLSNLEATQEALDEIRARWECLACGYSETFDLDNELSGRGLLGLEGENDGGN